MKERCIAFSRLVETSQYWIFELDQRPERITKPQRGHLHGALKRGNRHLLSYFIDFLTPFDAESADDVWRAASGFLLSLLEPTSRVKSRIPRRCRDIFAVYQALESRASFRSSGFSSIDGPHHDEILEKKLIKGGKELFERWLAFALRALLEPKASTLKADMWLPLTMNQQESLLTGRCKLVSTREGTKILARKKRKSTHYFEACIRRHPRRFHESLLSTHAGITRLHRLIRLICDMTTTRESGLPIYSSALRPLVAMCLRTTKSELPECLSLATLEPRLGREIDLWVRDYHDDVWVRAYLTDLVYHHLHPLMSAELVEGKITRDIELGWHVYVCALRRSAAQEAEEKHRGYAPVDI